MMLRKVKQDKEEAFGVYINVRDAAMRICFLINSMGKGGAERVVSILSDYFINEGDNVTIMIFDNSESQYSLNSEVEFIKLGLSGINKSWCSSMKNAHYKTKVLSKYINEIKPDVIVAFSIKFALLAKFACPSFVVIGSERSNPFVQRKGTKNKWITMLSPMIDGCIFQTKGAAAFYPKTLLEKSVIIPNAVTSEIGESTLDYQKRNKAICSVGRLENVKRFDLIIKAFASISNLYPDYNVYIYGEGTNRKKLESLINSYGLENRIFLPGNVNNVAEILSETRIFVLSSDHEGMPNALIEAMASGCACISTDCNFGPSELIESGYNGILVETGSYQCISEALKKLLSNLELAISLSENAKKTRENLSADKICRLYKNYFLKVAEK